MRCFVWGVIGMALFGGVPVAARQRPIDASAAATMEAQVLRLLNVARADPAAYARSLRTFRGLFHANFFVTPGRNVMNQTQEGVAAVDDAIGFLSGQRQLLPIQNNLLLAAAATDHVAEQARSGEIGHGDRDGEGPGDRVRRHGGGAMVAEVIEYGAVDAAEVVRQLVVDDGEPDRGHRAILFDPHLRFAGVSCGPHRFYRQMCVIDLASTSDGSPERSVQVAASGDTIYEYER